ncbi:MAG: TetR/AcrR family transcriptional regulator [Sphingomonas sp.]|jgi:AcrR family transcriptional regulator|uniref:TetR/AcrR family transcriptional regulator n=1 Tax=Sphingomonas sp. TaxID=28214 RepID=UPI003566B447
MLQYATIQAPEGPIVLRRKQPTQDRAKVTSDAILEAAEIILLADGYEKANTNYIAERAGVSIGSLYQYFPNKESIVSALIEQTVSRVANGLRTELHASIDLPMETASRNAFQYLLENFRENAELFYVIPNSAPELMDLTRNLSVTKFTHLTTKAILEHHRSEIAVADIEQALVVLEIAILANLKHYILENASGMTDDDFIDSMVRLSLAFLRTDGIGKANIT